MDYRSFYWFCYYSRNQNPNDKRIRIGQVRDGLAQAELAGLMSGLGYQYGGPIPNYPRLKSEAYQELNLNFIQEGDLIMLCTRPPIHDEQEQESGAVIIRRSYTALEKRIFEEISLYIRRSSRKTMAISREKAVFLNRKDDFFAISDFITNGNPWVKRGQSHNFRYEVMKNQKITLAYFIYLPQMLLVEGEAKTVKLLASWGMSGRETIVWNAFVRRNFRQIWGQQLEDMTEPVFAVATMQQRTELGREQINMELTNLTFTQNWDIKLIINLNENQ